MSDKLINDLLSVPGDLIKGVLDVFTFGGSIHKETETNTTSTSDKKD